MAVPKKRTSKAKKNKRKTAWNQKALKLTISDDSRVLHSETFMPIQNTFRNQKALKLTRSDDSRVLHSETFPPINIIGFQPALQFKFQLAHLLSSKKKQFLADEVKPELEAQSRARINFNPQSVSKEELDNVIKARFAYTAKLAKEKAERRYKKQHQKETDRLEEEERIKEALKKQQETDRLEEEERRKEALKNKQSKNEKPNSNS